MSDTTYKWRMDDGGWGVPPQAPAFSVQPGNQQITLSWNLAATTEIDGKIICRSKGLIIRRSISGFPENENDGDLVTDTTTLSGTYTDTGLTNDTTYYYRAFAYSDHNVINRDPAAKGSGVPSPAAHITVTCPTIMNGATVTAKKGATTESATVVNGTADIAVFETGTWDVMGITVVVESLGASYTARIVVFGFYYSETNSDPDSVSYPSGVDNYGWTPFQMNLTSGVPDYGSWNPSGTNADLLTWLFPKSCMLKYDGTVDYYLFESDETKKSDGVTASDVASTSYAGNAMMEWGQDGKKIWWKLVPDAAGTGFTFYVANAQADSNYHAWSHYDANGHLAPHFYTAKYFGSNVSSKLRSISGQTNMVSQTRNTEVTYARANNTGADIIWDTEVYADWFLIGMLCCLMGKSMNTQAKFGKGNCSTSAAIGQGTMNGKGMFFGKSDGSSGVKVFGMENFWGNIWRAIRGLVTDGSTKAKVKLTHGTQDGSTASDYNFDGTGYIQRNTISGTSGGYINAMDIDAKGLIPKTVSGSETTYYTDGCWFAASCYALVGGDWAAAGKDGALCVSLSSAASDTGTNIGAALSCKPLAE